MSDPKIDNLIARGRTLTGRKLRDAIKAASGEVIGGRGILVSRVNGQTIVSLAGHPIIPKGGVETFPCRLLDFPAPVEFAPNRWAYQWQEATLGNGVPGTWFVLSGGRNSTQLGPAYNMAEVQNTEDRAFMGTFLPDLPGTLDVLPITDANIGSFTKQPVFMRQFTQPDGSIRFWFEATNGGQPTCTAQIAPPPPVIPDLLQ